MAQRRNDGAGARTLGRQIAALRSFARFCERRGYRRDHRLHQRPPAETAEKPAEGALHRRGAELIDTAEALAEEPWIAARDTAVLMLLYGCGLRISEALGLTRADAPTGSVEPSASSAKAGASGSCRCCRRAARGRSLCRDLPLRAWRRPSRSSAARAAGRFRRASSSSRRSGCEARSGSKRASRRMRSAIPSRRTSSAAAAICGRSRSCSATPACRRRRSIRRSIPSACSRSIGGPIQGLSASIRAKSCVLSPLVDQGRPSTNAGGVLYRRCVSQLTRRRHRCRNSSPLAVAAMARLFVDRRAGLRMGQRRDGEQSSSAGSRGDEHL